MAIKHIFTATLQYVSIVKFICIIQPINFEMIIATLQSMSYASTKPIKLKSFIASLILGIINMAINIFAFTRLITNDITYIPTSVCVLTIASATLLLTSMRYSCIGIITLLKTFTTNYRSKTSLSALVILIFASYICLYIAFSMLELSNANTIVLIIMSLEIPVMLVLVYCITQIYNIESGSNQIRTIRSAHNMPIRANIQHNSSTTIDSGYMSGGSYSESNLSIQLDEVSLSIPEDRHEDPLSIPYIDDLGSQEDMRTAMTTSVKTS